MDRRFCRKGDSFLEHDSPQDEKGNQTTIEERHSLTMRLQSTLSAAFIVAFLLLSGNGAEGFAMVENSVKFALDRCSQFLRLARLLKPEAAHDREVK